MNAPSARLADATAALAFLAGGGQTGALMRAHDWRRSPLGLPEGWPDALKTAAALCLNSEIPVLLAWGPELLTLHNDAWHRTVGSQRHAPGLGRPGIECWPAIWDTIAPHLDGVMRDGAATGSKDTRLFVDRDGYPEEMFFTYTCGPIKDAAGRTGGVYSVFCETTGQVLAARRLEVLGCLSESAAAGLGVADACRAIDAILAGRPDTVFSRIFLSRAGARADLISEPFGPAAITPPSDASDPWGIAETIRSGRVTVLEDPQARFGDLPSAPWPEAPRRALVLPIVPPGPPGGPSGALVVGTNPRRPLDDDYLRFLRLVARHVASTVAVAAAHEDQRRRAVTEVQQTQIAELQAVLDSLPTPVWVTRDRDAMHAWCNRQAAELLRLPQAGLYRLGERTRWAYRVLRNGVEAPRETLPFLRAARGEETQPEELELHFADGVVRHVIGRARPLLDTSGAVTGAVIALVDITERKLAEAALQNANEMLETRVADRTAELEMTIKELRAQMEERERMEVTLRQMQRLEAVGQLTAGVAHDFNNLLTVILGNVEFLERETSNDATRRLATLRAAAQRGARLTGQLLAFARRQQLQPEAVDLNAVIAGMTDLLRTTAGGAIDVRMLLSPELWHAMVDVPQTELLILNLALNARDAMPDGGTLTIETANTRLGESQGPEQPQPGEYVTLRLSDTGSGMTPDVLARAFEPFFTTKPAGKGSGLGLAQVYGFTQQSGGGVEIDSRPGAGTTVRVHLPRAAAIAANAPIDLRGRRARILVVDDDPAVREVTAAMLEDAGYEVAQSASAAAALAALEAGDPPDLLVADFAMPGMNGLQLASAARERYPDMSVLFITGYAGTTLASRIDRAAVLRKPFRSLDLERSIRNLLGARDTQSTAG